MDSSDLDVELVSNSLELIPFLRELGESDVNGGSEGSSQVGGARGDVTKMVVMGEFCLLLDVSAGSAESVKDGVEVSTLLHGDDSELILFVNPHKEGLIIIVENTSAIGPISVEIAGFKESISLSILNK